MLRRLAALLCMSLMAVLAVVLPTASSHVAVPAQQQPIHAVAVLRQAAPVATVVHTASTPAIVYTVKSGDTLWGIAASHLGSGAKYTQLAAANGIANPDLIFPGEKITISGASIATTTTTTKPLAPKSSSPLTGTVVGGGCGFHTGPYSFSQLESLWVCNGGSVSAEHTAAAVALCESSGISTNTNGSDVGLWQINRAAWGSTLATFDPNGNARAAIQISGNGSNWHPWTCFRNGGYLKF